MCTIGIVLIALFVLVQAAMLWGAWRMGHVDRLPPVTFPPPDRKGSETDER